MTPDIQKLSISFLVHNRTVVHLQGKMERLDLEWGKYKNFANSFLCMNCPTKIIIVDL
jgi:hypothetical protein